MTGLLRRCGWRDPALGFIAPQQNSGVTAFSGLLESDRRFA
jgi:hypothetical protein